jgi:TPR repeat protein
MTMSLNPSSPLVDANKDSSSSSSEGTGSAGTSAISSSGGIEIYTNVGAGKEGQADNEGESVGGVEGRNSDSDHLSNGSLNDGNSPSDLESDDSLSPYVPPSATAPLPTQTVPLPASSSFSASCSPVTDSSSKAPNSDYSSDDTENTSEDSNNNDAYGFNPDSDFADASEDSDNTDISDFYFDLDLDSSDDDNIESGVANGKDRRESKGDKDEVRKDESESDNEDEQHYEAGTDRGLSSSLSSSSSSSFSSSSSSSGSSPSSTSSSGPASPLSQSPSNDDDNTHPTPTELFDECKLKAGQGDLEAQFELGRMYFEEHDEDGQNAKEAFKLFKPLAKLGNPEAQGYLGVMYQNGWGVGQNDKKAVKWYRRAARQRFPSSQLALSGMYYNGEGVIKNRNKAFKLCKRAAKQEYPQAQCQLGTMYLNQEDYKKADKWYKRAAKQKYPQAQHSLEWMYSTDGPFSSSSSFSSFSSSSGPSSSSDSSSDNALNASEDDDNTKYGDKGDRDRRGKGEVREGESESDNEDEHHEADKDRGSSSSSSSSSSFSSSSSSSGSSSSSDSSSDNAANASENDDNTKYGDKGDRDRRGKGEVREGESESDNDIPTQTQTQVPSVPKVIQAPMRRQPQLFSPSYNSSSSFSSSSNSSSEQTSNGMFNQFKLLTQQERSDANAQFNLGRMYSYGDGVEKNYKKGAKWYRRAAKRGHVRAQIGLSDMYYRGWGVGQNYKKGTKWNERAKKQSYLDAQPIPSLSSSLSSHPAIYPFSIPLPPPSQAKTRSLQFFCNLQPQPIAPKLGVKTGSQAPSSSSSSSSASSSSSSSSDPSSTLPSATPLSPAPAIVTATATDLSPVGSSSSSSSFSSDTSLPQHERAWRQAMAISAEADEMYKVAENKNTVEAWQYVVVMRTRGVEAWRNVRELEWVRGYTNYAADYAAAEENRLKAQTDVALGQAMAISAEANEAYKVAKKNKNTVEAWQYVVVMRTRQVEAWRNVKEVARLEYSEYAQTVIMSAEQNRLEAKAGEMWALAMVERMQADAASLNTNSEGVAAMYARKAEAWEKAQEAGWMLKRPNNYYFVAQAVDRALRAKAKGMDILANVMHAQAKQAEENANTENAWKDVAGIYASEVEMREKVQEGLQKVKSKNKCHFLEKAKKATLLAEKARDYALERAKTAGSGEVESESEDGSGSEGKT